MIEIEGDEKAVIDMKRISERCVNVSPIMRQQITVLEAREATEFSDKYVQTGALRNSLTSSSAPGAIREVKNNELRFGTSIWYAKYQVVDPGPITAAGGLERKGHESAIMHKLNATDRERIARESGAYIMHGVRI